MMLASPILKTENFVKINVGNVDRILRIVADVLLITLALLESFHLEVG